MASADRGTAKERETWPAVSHEMVDKTKFTRLRLRFDPFAKRVVGGATARGESAVRLLGDTSVSNIGSRLPVRKSLLANALSPWSVESFRSVRTSLSDPQALLLGPR